MHGAGATQVKEPLGWTSEGADTWKGEKSLEEGARGSLRGWSPALFMQIQAEPVQTVPFFVCKSFSQSDRTSTPGPLHAHTRSRPHQVPFGKTHPRAGGKEKVPLPRQGCCL